MAYLSKVVKIYMEKLLTTPIQNAVAKWIRVSAKII